MKTWHSAKTSNGQGLIIEDSTGRNVAVTYDEKDAALIAAAPDLLAALETLAESLQFEKKRSGITYAGFETAHAAISKARGE